MYSEDIEKTQEISQKLDSEGVAIKSLAMTALKSAERQKYTESNLDMNIIGYLAGCEALNFVNMNGNHNYIDRNEVFDLVEVDTSENNTARNDYLIKMLDAAMVKKQNYQKVDVDNRLNFEELGALKQDIKINNFIMLNYQVKDMIESHYSYFRLREALDTAFAKSTSAGSKYARYGDFNKFEKETSGIIEGMKNEKAFEDIVCYGLDDNIELLESNSFKDAKGVDAILKVRLSANMLPGDLFKFASIDEIEAENYIERELPVDIKSTEAAVDAELSKQFAYGQLDHWVIWSHLYSNDFRLDIDKFSKLPIIGYEKDEAPLMLKSKQIEAMERLGETNIMYFDANGNKFMPEPLDIRINSIKTDVLCAINALYKEPSQISIA